ncbi:ATP-binding protein [Pseudoalteromonas sp. T1lg22]|uniref:ATP-binding protein n=1 Tax=Pseudoalteromonas sp. T1lg22 TaxID=2077096 RepID=UPI00131A401C|nr:ATP-binding protein [Pseudoalteromonas sp. T1lg22]
MRKQFFRLYVFIIVSVIAALIAFGQIYQNYVFEQSPSIALPVSQWPALIDNKGDNLVSLARRDLALPPALAQQLNEQKMLTVIQSEGNFVYVLGSGDKADTVYRIGPITVAPPPDEHSIYFLLVYSAIALLVMSFIWPVFKDLAELKRASRRFAREKKAFSAKVKPSSTVYPLAQTLSDMAERISKFIQLHEDLSRIISHEIRTPLSRMRFILSLHSELDEEIQRTMARNIDEIENRLCQYLDFARVEYLTQPLQLQALDAKEFINQEAKKNQLFTDVNIETKVALDKLYCEPNSFAILVQNLLFNGVKYAQHQVILRLQQQEQMQVIEVYDDGPGLPNDAVSLLAPFSSSKDSAVASGYGLGLYIVERICLWHGGQMTLGKHPETGGAHIRISWPRQIEI